METSQLESPEVSLIEMAGVTLTPLQMQGATEVENINWRVVPETFWVIAGLFGSGKSDFLSTAAGLQRPARGVVKLFGEETFSVGEEILIEQRRKIGLVFAQGGRLFNRMTVAENVALPLRYHHNLPPREAEKSVREILELTALVPFAHQLPNALSPDWQQRAALARSLILQPEILLLDKPLAGMDFRHQRWTLDFLTKLAEGSAFYGGRKVTIVVSADNLQPWKKVGKQFAVLKNNQWHEIGGRTELETGSEPLLREFWEEET